MPDQPLTDERLRDHAFEQAGAGDIIGARQTVSKMIDRQYLREAWIAILHNQMRLGDLQGVKETIASFPDDSFWHSHSNFYLPLDFARAGDVPGAIEIANKMRGRILVLGMIALVQARKGDFVVARETVSLIDDESFRIEDESFRSKILDFVSELQREGKIPEESSQH
jgi:hypothetical protein